MFSAGGITAKTAGQSAVFPRLVGLNSPLDEWLLLQGVEIRSTWEPYLEKRRPEGMESERDWITDWDGVNPGSVQSKVQNTGRARASAL